LLGDGPYATELAGTQHALRVGELGPDLDRAGLLVDRPIDEDRLTLLWKHAAVGKDQIETGRAIARHLPAPQAGDPLHQSQVIGLGDGEVHVDRIDGRDRGQQGGIALADQIARVDAELADDAVDGRLDRRVVEVELGLRDGRLARLDRRLREL